MCASYPACGRIQDRPADHQPGRHRLGVVLPSYAAQRSSSTRSPASFPSTRGMTYARLDMTEFIDDEIPMPAAVSFKQLKVAASCGPARQRLTPAHRSLHRRIRDSERQGPNVGSVRRRVAAPEAATGDTLMATFGFTLFPFKSGTLSRQSYGLSRVEPDPRSPQHSRRRSTGHSRPGACRDHYTGRSRSRPAYAVSQVYDRVPKGTAFLAMTLEQAGTNAAVRCRPVQISADGTGTQK